MPDWVQMIGLALKEGSPSIVQYAKEYFQGDELEKTQAIQKASFARMHEVLLDGPASTEAEHGDDCPSCKIARSEKAVVGTRTWLLLHGLADSYDPAARKKTEVFVKGLILNFPCTPCARDAEEYLEDHPLDFTTRRSLQRSLCSLHDHVNQKLGKPLHGCR